MHHSVISKVSGLSSILNSVSPDQNMEILRISLKKQLDRKEKLQRLQQKYQLITSQQKTHIQVIKSNIIELKDLEYNNKTKFYLNPAIYVDNYLSKETRQFLCMLLNSFYSKYDENQKCQQKTKIISQNMNQLLQNISKNQKNLLKIQKQTIEVQVHLQGQLYGYKNKLKDQSQRQKQLEEQNKRVTIVCSKFEQTYRQQLNKVQKLRRQCQQIQLKIEKLKKQISQGQLVKKGKQEIMANQITYQEKFNIQLTSWNYDIAKEYKIQKTLKNKIKQKKHRVQQLKATYDKLSRFSQFNQTQRFKSFKKTEVNMNFQTKINRCFFTQFKKFSDLVNQISPTQDQVNSEFVMQIKSKDTLNHEIQMKILQEKNDENKFKNKQKISIR